MSTTTGRGWAAAAAAKVTATALAALLGAVAFAQDKAPTPPAPPAPPAGGGNGAAPAAKPAPEKDWSAHMGDLPFVVGHARGLAEVKFTGRPPMYVFTSATDPWCPKFAARTWTDRQTLAKVAGWTYVLIDVHAEKAFAETCGISAEVLPGIVWADFDDKSVFMSQGDVPLDMFRSVAEIGAAHRPEAKPPSDGYTALLELGRKLETAMAGDDVKAQLAAVAEIRKVGLGADVQRAARRADAKITESGLTRVQEARQLVAAKKKPDAKKALTALVALYGANHEVSLRAQEVLDEIAGKKRPPATKPPEK